MQRMTITRHVRLGIKNLMLHRLRSLLTMLGVVFGVGSVIAMLAVAEGASRQTLAQIQKLGSRNIIIRSTKPVEDESRQKIQTLMSIYGLKYEDPLRIGEAVPAVQRVVPAKLVRKEARVGPRTLEVRVVGTSPDWFKLVQRPLVAGRYLLEQDLGGYSNAVVLTEHVARQLLITQGAMVRIGGDYFEVVGIVASDQTQGSGVQMPDDPLDAYIPINVARQRYGDTSMRSPSGASSREQVQLHLMIVQATSEDEVKPVAAAIEAMLTRFHKKQDYRLMIPLALLRQAQAHRQIFKMVLGSIAGISLLVGGIGIMNIMLAAVTERTREIGVRRAIGARRLQIVSQFLVETLVLSTAGGLIGIATGLVLPWLITQISQVPTVVRLYSLVLAVGISMTVGIIFGLYPAIRAARVDPIVALRHE